MDADELFGLPLDQFVPERAALAKRLRADGRRDEAAEVARTRKPSVAAWAVNQLVRTQRAAVDELFDAGDAAQHAQAAMLAGRGEAAELRAATAREREAVDGLMQAARGLLSSEGQGLSPSVVDRVSDTLHAAALEEGARQAVHDGRLERELQHIGLGGDVGLAFAVTPQAPPTKKTPGAKKTPEAKNTPAAKSPGAKAKPAARATEPDRARERRAEARRLERERAEAVTAARVAESDARRAAERAARALELAEERQARAARALDEADEALDAAKAEADAAAATRREAEVKLRQLKR